MENEKLKILKLLEEGRITADEAAKLLEAAGRSSYGASPRPKEPAKPANYTMKDESSYKSAADSRAGNGPNPGSKTYSTKGIDDFTSDLSKKFETFAKDMEPKIYKFTEAVAETTEKMADKLSKTFATPPAGTGTRAYSTSTASPSYTSSKQGTGAYTNMTERSFEAFVTPGYNELNFSGLNGDVLIKGYNGDKISARIYYRSKKSGAPIEIMQLGNKYFLNYDEDAFDKVCIDAFVPESMFNNVVVNTINGQLSISTIESDYLMCSNSNGKTKLKDIKSDNIKVDCNNGELSIENVTGINGQIENFNGSVQSLGLDVQNLTLSAANGAIHMSVAYFNLFKEYMWAIETSNARMTLNLPSAPELGYHVKAHATFSNIKVGLTGLNYICNDPSFIEARSHLYDEATTRIKMSLETSNGPLSIN